MSLLFARTAPARWIVLAGAGAVLAGCTAMPSFGPSSAAVNAAAADVVANPDDVMPFRIVDVSISTLPVDDPAPRHFPQVLRQQALRAEDDVIAIADQLDIRIWEIAEDGLFATAGRRETVLPVVVSNTGTITAPYAGTVVAKGLTASELRTALLQRYQGQAIEPEIAVTIAATQSNAVTVLGAVRSPGRAIVPSRGIKLLDLMAQMGGTVHPAWETRVSLQRGSTTGAVLLTDILNEAGNNIIILPDDVINVDHIPRRFAVYGAINRPGNIAVPLEHAVLSYLLAEVGGLDDGVAQAKSVFVFRPATGSATNTATAYRFDFSVPDAFLLAGQFRLEATDIVYVTSAEAADLQRFLSTVLTPLVSTTSTIARVGN